MRRLIAAFVPAVLVASPALAQHHDHGHHEPSAVEVKPEAKPDPHAGHDMPKAMDHSAHDPHAGHVMPQADPHAGHVMLPKAVPALVGSGPQHAADLYFDPADMAKARQTLLAENGDVRVTSLSLERLEARFADGDVSYGWEAEGFVGGDINRFWWKTDGEGDIKGSLNSVSVQALYGRAIAPFWDVQAGVQHDYDRKGPDRTHLSLGIEGVSPFWFEVSAAALLSNKGDLTAEFEAEYDLRLTQKWIVQPVAHVGLSAQDVPELDLGSGVTSVSAAVLLRYEIRRELAPYVGVEWETAVGRTADLIRAQGRATDQTRVVVGLRAWF